MKRGSLVSRIAFTLVTAVLIPFLVVFGLLFYTEWSTKELIYQSSNRVLTQFLFVVDNTMLEASNTALSIGNNKQCQTYAMYAAHQPEKTAYQTIVVRDELTERNNVKYCDILVYYPKDDLVISAVNGAAIADDYFAANYALDGYDRENFKDILEMGVARPHVFRLEGEQTYLCVGMRQIFQGNEDRDFVVVLVMRPEYLSGLTLDSQQDDNGNLLIYDRNKELIIGSNENGDYPIDWYDETDAQKDVRSENGEYTIQVQAFSSVDGYCAYVLPTHMFWDTIEQARIVLIVGLLVCLVIGVFVVFRGTKKVYTPIKNVVKEIKSEKLVQMDSVSDEMELIKEAITSNRDDKHLLDRLNKENAVTQKRKAVHSLMQGDRQPEGWETVLQKHGVNFLSDCFAVGIIRVSHGGTIERKQQDFVIRNVFAEIAQQQGVGYFAESGDNQHMLLVNFRDSDRTGIDASCWEAACRFLEEHYEASVSVYFSQKHLGLEAVPLAYQEALTAQKYRYLLGDTRYIDYASIKDREFNYVSSMESMLSRMVIGYLKERTHSVSEEAFIAQILEMYSINAQSSMDTVECFKYEMLSVLHKAMATYSHAQNSEMLDEMIHSQSLEEFREKLVEIIRALLTYKQESSKTQDLCKKITDFIHANYYDAELSMESIGRQVHMSPYYASKLFKAEHGISVSAYIAKVRIDQAKKALRETDKSIAKIAEETGFLSSTVFIRTFKKAEGITPGVYRSIKE